MLSRSIADRLCMAWLGLYMRWSPIEANGSIICLYGGEGEEEKLLQVLRLVTSPQ